MGLRLPLWRLAGPGRRHAPEHEGRHRRLFRGQHVLLRLRPENRAGRADIGKAGGRGDLRTSGRGDPRRHPAGIFQPRRPAVRGHPDGLPAVPELFCVRGQGEADRRAQKALPEGLLQDQGRLCGRDHDVPGAGGKRAGGPGGVLPVPGGLPRVAPLREPRGHHHLGAVEQRAGRRHHFRHGHEFPEPLFLRLRDGICVPRPGGHPAAGAWLWTGALCPPAQPVSAGAQLRLRFRQRRIQFFLADQRGRHADGALPGALWLYGGGPAAGKRRNSGPDRGRI